MLNGSANALRLWLANVERKAKDDLVAFRVAHPEGTGLKQARSDIARVESLFGAVLSQASECLLIAHSEAGRNQLSGLASGEENPAAWSGRKPGSCTGRSDLHIHRLAIEAGQPIRLGAGEMQMMKVRGSLQDIQGRSLSVAHLQTAQ